MLCRLCQLMHIGLSIFYQECHQASGRVQGSMQAMLHEGSQVSMTSGPCKHRSTSMTGVLPPMVRCERADMGPDEMLMGELPLTGQLPCRSMLCRGALSWGALHISAETSWVSPSPDLSSSDFAAAAPIIPCVGACWIQVFVFETIVSMHFAVSEISGCGEHTGITRAQHSGRICSRSIVCF